MRIVVKRTSKMNDYTIGNLYIREFGIRKGL